VHTLTLTDAMTVTMRHVGRWRFEAVCHPFTHLALMVCGNVNTVTMKTIMAFGLTMVGCCIVIGVNQVAAATVVRASERNFTFMMSTHRFSFLGLLVVFDQFSVMLNPRVPC
jgi:hypothetical protein